MSPIKLAKEAQLESWRGIEWTFRDPEKAVLSGWYRAAQVEISINHDGQKITAKALFRRGWHGAKEDWNAEKTVALRNREDHVEGGRVIRMLIDWLIGLTAEEMINNWRFEKI